MDMVVLLLTFTLSLFIIFLHLITCDFPSGGAFYGQQFPRIMCRRCRLSCLFYRHPLNCSDGLPVGLDRSRHN